MNKSPQELTQSLLEILKIPLKIQSWRQVVALALMLGAIVFIVSYLFSPVSPSRREFTVPTDKATTEYIEDVRKRARADAIIVYRYSPAAQELQQIFTSWGNYSSEPISELNNSTDMQSLRLGNCIKIEKIVTDRSNGNKVNVLICGVVVGRKPGTTGGARLEGAVAGVYYEFPLKTNEGGFDPAAFWIYQIGLDLSAAR